MWSPRHELPLSHNLGNAGVPVGERRRISRGGAGQRGRFALPVAILVVRDRHLGRVAHLQTHLLGKNMTLNGGGGR